MSQASSASNGLFYPPEYHGAAGDAGASLPESSGAGYYGAEGYYSSWYSAGGPPGYDIISQLQQETTPVDEGIAWFKLVFSSGYLTIAVVVMVLLVRARNVFEIRARSVYLVILTGLCMMAALGLILANQIVILYHLSPNAYILYMVYYFALVCSTCCYGSRAVRLAILYSPRARKAVPSLVSERNHVAACICIGLMSLAFPLYDMQQFDSQFAQLEFAVVSEDRLWKVTVGCQVLVATLYPLVWKVEDIFNVGCELKIMNVLQLLVTVGGKISEDYGGAKVVRWINVKNMGFSLAVIMFGVTVFSPVWQLKHDPLTSSDPQLMRALDRRKRRATGIGGFASFAAPSWKTREAEISSATSKGDDDTVLAAGSHTVADEPWTYEKVAAVPELAAAFEEFSVKALCQESVLFLQQVSMYHTQHEDDDHSDAQLEAFRDITRRYIIDGSLDEVNISSDDKKEIMDVFNGGKQGFYELSYTSRRFIFTRAYAEVRFMLESNLMTKFVSTYEFRRARAKAEDTPHPA